MNNGQMEENLPDICGSEDKVRQAVLETSHVFRPESQIDFPNITSAFAIALHMHQPLIPAEGTDLQTAKIISNLKYMMDNQHIGDNHNAPAFHWCYKRIGEFIPQLVDEGHQPRVMLDYSGCILYGMKQMGLEDVFENLKCITCDPVYRHCVEWLGSAWGHPVAPSTPAQDFRLHVTAWQEYFASLFGFDALSRVKGFSPTEMALPNHPDVCFEFVKTLKESGYRWIIVQEHTVEEIDGQSIQQPHVPHRLLAKNSKGETMTIIAMVKTQGSDTKLIGQMQPYYEAKSLSTKEFGSQRIPPLVTQISDGENGGVMMNEFPGKFLSVIREASGSSTPAINVTEYLEFLETMGLTEPDFPTIQPVMQKRVWDRFEEGAGPDRLKEVVENLEKENNRFHVQGGSWTNNISWVKGYEHVLGPMEKASALFAEKALNQRVSSSEPRYRNALFHLLITQTSCYRYWGHGIWTDYGRELCRRTMEILKHDF